MYQHKIIHVPQIMLDSQPFLDKMVEIVQHAQFHQLTDLASESNPNITVKRIDHIADRLRRSLIVNTLHDGFLCHVVPSRWEELTHIAFQHPSVCTML